MFRRIVVLAVALSMGAVTVACTGPAQPSPTPTPSPTFACIPEAGGDPVPCGPIEYEQAQKRDKLYADAEAVYRRYWTEMNRLATEKSPPFTDVLESTTAGKFRDNVVALLSPEHHAVRVSGQSKLERVARLPGLSRDGSTVALLVCTDSRDGTYVDASSGAALPGIVSEQRLFLGPAGGSLRIVNSEIREIDQC